MSIGTLGEKSLHAALKAWYQQPDDRCEVQVDGYVIDILRDQLLIEIQTRNFATLKRKLNTLLKHHPLCLVHPIAQEKWIIRQEMDGRIVSRRRSPKRGSVYQLFAELVYLPGLLLHANFSLEVALIHEEEIRVNDGQGSWRRSGWSIADRRLVAVAGRITLRNNDDIARLLPVDLPPLFTTRELAEAIGEPLRLAQKMAYCLRVMGIIEQAGKRGNSWLYRRLPSA